MKIIDLLNKIAKREKLPEEIKVIGGTYYLCENDQSGCCYFSEKPGYGGVKLSFDTSVMNEEVEIIEEDKKIENLEYYDNSIMWCMNGREITDNEKDIIDKINEIIDYINKGEK